MYANSKQDILWGLDILIMTITITISHGDQGVHMVSQKSMCYCSN